MEVNLEKSWLYSQPCTQAESATHVGLEGELTRVRNCSNSLGAQVLSPSPVVLHTPAFKQ